jgi:site-specific DNA-cytosine methylase
MVFSQPHNPQRQSLSDVLESRVPPRFFLSPRAARGILRRAEKRGRKLPPRLQAALEGLAAEGRMTEPISLIRSANPMATTGTAAREATDATILSLRRLQAATQSKLIPATVTEGRQTSLPSPMSPNILKPEQAADGYQTQKKPQAGLLSVRRLTPSECEVLQGFPKGWTIPNSRDWPKARKS